MYNGHKIASFSNSFPLFFHNVHFDKTSHFLLMIIQEAKICQCPMVFFYQNCSDLLWEKKIALVIEKNVWNLKAIASKPKIYNLDYMSILMRKATAAQTTRSRSLLKMHLKLFCCFLELSRSKRPKPSLKIGTAVTKAFLFWYWQQLKKVFLGIKLFCFSR